MNTLMLRRVLRQVTAFAVGFALIAILELALAAPTDVNADPDGLALRGYDPVAYFDRGRAVPGKREFIAEFAGATYRFASPENRDAFKADPVKHAPQYGGYCALGVALGRKLDGDPNVWQVVDGKLYLNVNAEAATVWSKGVAGNIAKANASWPRIKDRPASAL